MNRRLQYGLLVLACALSVSAGVLFAAPFATGPCGYSSCDFPCQPMPDDPDIYWKSPYNTEIRACMGMNGLYCNPKASTKPCRYLMFWSYDCANGTELDPNPSIYSTPVCVP